MPRRRPRDLRPSDHIRQAGVGRVPHLTPEPSLPRQGRPLADAVALSEHCLERYRIRAERPAELRLRTLREELRGLIASRGVAVRRPPSWFYGGLGATVFYITIDGRWLLPVQAARRADGVLPAVPYVATTFISRDLVDAELAGYTSEELAALVLLPLRVARTWPGAADDGTPADKQLRAAIAASGRAHHEPPVWLRTQRPQRERFYISLNDGTSLVVVRARRSEGQRAPFRAVELVHDGALRALHGDELLEAVVLDHPAIEEYRDTVPGLPDDARSHLQQRIRSAGWLTDELPGWAGDDVTWQGPVLRLGDDVALLLQPLVDPKDGKRARWRAVRCIAR